MGQITSLVGEIHSFVVWFPEDEGDRDEEPNRCVRPADDVSPLRGVGCCQISRQLAFGNASWCGKPIYFGNQFRGENIGQKGKLRVTLRLQMFTLSPAPEVTL